MNIEESVEIIGAMQIAYPNYNPKDILTGAKFMAAALNEYTFQECYEALIAFCTTHATGFAPSIGDLVDEIHKLRKAVNGNEISDAEAWVMVRKAISKGTYNSNEVFDAFPDEIKRAVGSPHQLYVWATDEEFNEGVVQSNFLRSYRNVKEQVEKYERLPMAQKIAIENKRQQALELNSRTALEVNDGN